MDTKREAPRSRTFGFGVALTLLAAIVLGACSGTGRAAAQDTSAATPLASAGISTVTVSGHGAVTIPPDTATVTVGVDVTRQTLDAAQAEATAQATAILAAAKTAGVVEKDIQTANYSVNVIRDYDRDGNPGKITGYQVSNQVNLTLRDLDKVGDILDSLVAAGANNVYGISFFVEDPTAASSQARKAAVGDARTKADELATASGMRLGRVISISESFAPPPAPQVFNAAAGDVAAQKSSVPIQTGTSEITVDVEIVFALE